MGGIDGGCQLGKSEIFFYKETGNEFFIWNPNLTKKIFGGWEWRGWGVARVSDFFFSKESKSEFFKGWKVREDWLV